MSNEMPIVDPVIKNFVDNMTHEQLAFKWANAPVGDKMLKGPMGEYFKWKLFVHFGGINGDLAKKVGWRG